MFFSSIFCDYQGQPVVFYNIYEKSILPKYLFVRENVYAHDFSTDGCRIVNKHNPSVRTFRAYTNYLIKYL